VFVVLFKRSRRIIGLDKQRETYTYSVRGTIIGVKDALGNETMYTYNVCDRLVEVLQT